MKGKKDTAKASQPRNRSKKTEQAAGKKQLKLLVVYHGAQFNQTRKDWKVRICQLVCSQAASMVAPQLLTLQQNARPAAVGGQSVLCQRLRLLLLYCC